MIATLVKLKSLTYINHNSLADLITNIHGNHSNKQQVSPDDCYKLQLMKFQCKKDDQPGWLRKCIHTVCMHCPNLTDVSICDPVEEGCLTPLIKLKQLQYLQLHTLEENKACLHMDGGLAYLLWGRGYNLSQLQLDGVLDVDLCAIGQWCANLEVLAVTVPSFSVPPLASESCSGPCQKKPNLLYKKLKSLSLSSWSTSFSYPFTSHALTVILEGTPNLHTVRLCNISGLTDNVLSEVLEINPLGDLREVRLCGCDEISGDSILQLLLMPNNLEILGISNCQLVGCCNVDDMKAVIKEHKYATNVDYVPYGPNAILIGNIR